MKINRVLGALLAVVMGLACAHMAFAASASTPGAQLTEEALKDRAWTLYYSNIINNYAAKTAPGGADSSIAWNVTGATRISIRLYAIVGDSASAMRHQILYVQARYHRSGASDTTSAFAHLLVTPDAAGDSLGATVRYAPFYTDGATALNWILYSQPGEIAVFVPPFDKISHRYVTINLPDPPAGTVYASVRVRVGYAIVAGLIRGYSTNAIETKWTAGYRVDLLGGR